MDTPTANPDSAETPRSTENSRVVVFAAPHISPDFEAKIAELMQTDVATARYTVRNLPGLIPGQFDRENAAALARFLRDTGVSATAIPSSEVPDLSHAQQTHHVRLTDQSLLLEDLGDPPLEYPWSDVQFLSIGVTPADGHHREASSLAMASSRKSWNDGVDIEGRKRPEAFLVVAGNQRDLLLASDEMNYEYLGERISNSSSANFNRLMQDIVQHAPDIWLTPSSRNFMDRGPARHCEFPSRRDLQRYTEFQMLLRGKVQSVS